MTNIIDKIDQICRVCLLENPTMFSIQHKTESNEQVSKMLMSCSAVQVEMNDNLPQLLCINCLERLETAYLFKQECERSDHTLRQLILENANCINEGSEIQNLSEFDVKINASAFVKTEIKDEEIEPLDIFQEDNFNQETISSDSDDNLNLYERKKRNREKHKKNVKNITSDLNQSKNVSRKQSYICSICEKSFKDHSNFWKHREKENHLYFSCYVCWKQFPDKVKLEKHNGDEHQNQIFICEEGDCDKEFNNFQSFIFHKKIDHEVEKYLQCLECDKVFSCHEQWDIHVQRHLSNPFKCALCEEKFSTRIQFQAHIDTHSDYYKCPICSRQCTDKKMFDRHKKIHESSFICEECGKQFTNKPNLKLHVNVKHKGLPGRKKKPYEKNHLCPLCGKTFQRPYKLQLHLQDHAGIKSFSCDKCNYRTNSKRHLKNHARTHTGERPFTCEFCGKAFSCRSYLTVHRRYHTGERPFKCTFPNCEKGFTTSGDLKVHERTHTGVKLFHCKICDSSFTTLHYLKVHTKKHENQ